jgi:glycosyltransferase involved in cell wall biosynthesis
MSRGRILLTTDAVGGVWSYTVALASGLVEAGTECVVATLGPRPNAAQRARAQLAGIALIETDLCLEWTAVQEDDVAAASFELARLARARCASSVHLHTPALALAFYDMPVVAVAHSCVGTWWQAVQTGALPVDLRWRTEQFRAGLRAVTELIAPSAAFADALHDIYGEDAAISVVHNGLTPEFGPSCDRGNFVFAAGRLWDAGKNFATLDAASASLKWPVEVAGPIQFPGHVPFVAHNLYLLGHLDAAAMQARYRTCALFAAPSIYEPFGLAVLEAASAASPLVLADIPTFRELWHGAAVFVPPRDASAWTKAISDLMAAPDQRAALGEAAHRRAMRYSLSAMVAQTSLIHRRATANASVVIQVVN